MSHVLHRTNNILQYNIHFWKAIDIKVYSKSFSQHRFEQCSFAHHEILRNSKNITYIDRSAAFLMVLSWEIFIRMSEFPTFLWNFLKFLMTEDTTYFFKLWIVWIWKIYYYLFKNISTMQCVFFLHNGTSCRWKGW